MTTTVYAEGMGESGQIPKFIYINTSDTLSEVESIGWLNSLKNDGYNFKPSDMVLVCYKTGPRSKKSSLFNVTEGGNDLTLVIITSGLGFDPATSYKTGSLGGPITGGWQHVGEFNVQAGTGDVTIQSDTGEIRILAPNAGEKVYVNSDNVELIANNTLILNGSLLDSVVGGNIYFESGAEFYINASILKFQGIANSGTGFQLFYNPGDFSVTYAPASGGAAFDPSFSYTITGDWVFQGGFDVQTSAPILIQSISSNISLSAAATANITATDIVLDASNSVSILSVGEMLLRSSSATAINIENTNGGFKLTGPLGGVFETNVYGWLVGSAPLISFTGTNIVYTTGFSTVNYSGGNANYTIPGDFNINCSNVKLNSIFNAPTSYVLHYDTTTKKVSYGSSAPVWDVQEITTPGILTAFPYTTYIIKSSGVVFNMFAAPVLNAEFEFIGHSGGSYVINFLGGQTIRNVSTSGTVLTTATAFESFKIKCTTGALDFNVIGLTGNINIT